MFQRISARIYQISLGFALVCVLLLVINADWFFVIPTLYFLLVTTAAYRFLR